jgi:hypothetical protein
MGSVRGRRARARIATCPREYEGLDPMLTSDHVAAISDEVGDTIAFVLPEVMHGDFIETFGSDGDERGNDYNEVQQLSSC